MTIPHNSNGHQFIPPRRQGGQEPARGVALRSPGRPADHRHALAGHGTGTNIVFGCDNGLQGLPPAVLRVAIHDQNGWHITNNVTVDSTKGQNGVIFPNPASTGVISVRRQDAGQAVVGYAVS